jgi:hypothetical protein
MFTVYMSYNRKTGTFVCYELGSRRTRQQHQSYRAANLTSTTASGRSRPRWPRTFCNPYGRPRPGYYRLVRFDGYLCEVHRTIVSGKQVRALMTTARPFNPEP